MEYVNGIFVKRKTGKYGEYLVISIRDEALDNIASLPKSDDGFRVMIASPRKEDKDKFSVKPFVKKDSF